MKNEEKTKIMYEHLITDKTFATLKELEIYDEFINCLQDEDFTLIVDKNIYFSAFYSPASNSTIKVVMPVASNIIIFDVNLLKRYPKDERIAILLHEMGHVAEPNTYGMKSELENESNADDFAIQRGYSQALKDSLERFIVDFPKEFDKEITKQRIERLKKLI
jgi:hypothetical protein